MLSPKFDVNDVGYMSQADATNGHVGAGYKWTEPNRWRKDLTVVGVAVATGNRDGDLTSKGLYLNPTVTFANDWTINPEYFPFLSSKNDRRTRGGPLMFEPASTLVAGLLRLAIPGRRRPGTSSRPAAAPRR